jgi:tRNA pseudouridine38-40 synthase
MDCTVFAASGDKSHSRSRYIYNSVFWVEGSRLVYEITANAFLWKMVRSIVGTLLFYEDKHLPVNQLRNIIASGERNLAGPTAAAAGLFLFRIGY